MAATRKVSTTPSGHPEDVRVIPNFTPPFGPTPSDVEPAHLLPAHPPRPTQPVDVIDGNWDWMGGKPLLKTADPFNLQRLEVIRYSNSMRVELQGVSCEDQATVTKLADQAANLRAVVEKQLSDLAEQLRRSPEAKEYANLQAGYEKAVQDEKDATAAVHEADKALALAIRQGKQPGEFAVRRTTASNEANAAVSLQATLKQALEVARKRYHETFIKSYNENVIALQEVTEKERKKAVVELVKAVIEKASAVDAVQRSADGLGWNVNILPVPEPQA